MTSYDYSNGFAIRTTRFFMRFAGFWISNDKRGKLIMDLAMIYTIGAIMVASWITGTDLWYSRQNFSQGAYAASNAMTILIVLFKLIVFGINRDAFMNVINFCYVNFWERSYDSFGDNVLRNCEKRCVYFVCTFTFFAQCTVCSYMIHPIVENIGKNETDRILPFNIWLDLPLTTTPYYEITFSIESLALVHSGICFFCFDNLLCIVNVHTAGQFEILRRRFELIYDVTKLNNSSHSDTSCRKLSSNSDYKRYLINSTNPNAPYDEFKDCIRNHQSLISFTKMVEGVYTFGILGQFIVSSFLICLVSYQAILAEGSITTRMIFIVHSGGTFTQLFMFTLTCDDLIRASEAVADAAYRARWYCDLSNPANRQLSKDLIFVIVRARHPCCLTAGNFFPVSLETFTTIISTSMSYLTMLRQGQASSVK